MITLRPYQITMLDAAREHMRAGLRRILLVAPTGAGKRLMAVHTISRAIERGKRCCFLVHRAELLDQSSETLDQAGVRHGIIKSGRQPEYHQPCQVASVQTLVNRGDRAGKFDFMFVDEAHHAAASTWDRVLAQHPEAYILLFTATPQRLDGKGLAKYADAMVIGPGVRELIDQGYLADFRIFAPPPADLSDVHTVAGDYNNSELAEAIDKPRIVGDVVDHYQRIAPGTQAICFAVNRLHSRHLVEAFNASGISARHVDGETPRDERAMALEDFAKRRFQVLSSVDILGEGLDVAGIETVICARPTQSLTVCLQQVGRGLRVKPSGMPCVILDHAGNCRRHGLPDEPRTWELTGDKQRKRLPSEVPVRVCPQCFAACPAVTLECPECGHRFVAEPREVEHDDGVLEEIRNAEAWRKAERDFADKERRKRELIQARTLDQLVALGQSRGYRYARKWAEHIIAGRQRYREERRWAR